MKTLFEILVYILALYGLVSLISDSLKQFKQTSDMKHTKIKMVLLVKDQEEVIEGVVRNIYLERLLDKAMVSDKLTVIDMGSSDDTDKILSRLKDKYDFIDVITKEQKDKIFEEYV